MTERLFPAQEIGSLAKPRWQLLGQRGEALDVAARAEFDSWDRRLKFAGELPDRPGRPSRREHEGTRGRGRSRPRLPLRDPVPRGGRPRPGSTTGKPGGSRCTEHPSGTCRDSGSRDTSARSTTSTTSRPRSSDPVRLDKPFDVEEFDFVRRHAHAVPKIPDRPARTPSRTGRSTRYLPRPPEGLEGPQRPPFGAARVRGRPREERDPPDPPGPDRPRLQGHPDRRAGRGHPSGRDGAGGRGVQRRDRGTGRRVLDAHLLLGLPRPPARAARGQALQPVGVGVRQPRLGGPRRLRGAPGAQGVRRHALDRPRGRRRPS